MDPSLIPFQELANWKLEYLLRFLSLKIGYKVLTLHWKNAKPLNIRDTEYFHFCLRQQAAWTDSPTLRATLQIFLVHMYL